MKVRNLNSAVVRNVVSSDVKVRTKVQSLTISFSNLMRSADNVC